MKPFIDKMKKNSGINLLNDDFGKTLLHYAVEYNNEFIVKILIDIEFDIHAVDNLGQTPFLLSFETENINVLQALASKVSKFYIDDDIGRKWLCMILSNSNWSSSIPAVLFPKMKVRSGDDIELAKILIAEKCELCYAMWVDNPNVTKFMLDHGCSVETTDANGNNSLHIAVRLTHVENVGMLLERIANVDAQNANGETALSLAVQSKYVDMVKILLDFDAAVNIQNEKTEAPLLLAVRSGHIENVELLLDKGANVNAENNDGETALRLAIQFERPDVVKILLEHQANIYIKNQEMESALHLAVRSNNIKSVKLLLTQGIDIDARNRDGDTALHLATLLKQTMIVKLLLEYNADVNIKSNEEDTSLHLAARSKNSEIVKILLENKNIKVDAQGKDSETALFIAVKLNHIENVKLLLKHQANINIKNNKGTATLHLAACLNSTEILKLLLENRPKVNVIILDAVDNIPLHLAVSSGRLDNVKILLERELEVNYVNNKMETPLHLAMRGEYTEIAKLLLKKGADVNIKNNEGKIPLNYSKKPYWTTELQDILKMMIEHKSDLYLNDVNNRWQIFYILQNGPKEAVEILLNVESIFLERDHFHKTVIHHLVKNPNPGVFELLISHDIDVNISDSYGRTPLHCAAKAANTTACRILIDKGAKVNAIASTDRGVPLFYLMKYGEFTDIRECLILLLERGADAQVLDRHENTIFFLITEEIKQEVKDILLGYFALIESLGTIIIEPIRRDIKSHQEFKGYYDLCKLALENMKTVRIYSDITFLKLLADNERKVAGYMRNEEIVVKIKNFNRKYHFDPYCNKQFDERISGAIELAELIEKASMNLYNLINLVIPFDSYIVYEIVSYLERSDLKNLINA